MVGKIANMRAHCRCSGILRSEAAKKKPTKPDRMKRSLHPVPGDASVTRQHRPLAFRAQVPDPFFVGDICSAELVPERDDFMLVFEDRVKTRCEPMGQVVIDHQLHAASFCLCEPPDPCRRSNANASRTTAGLMSNRCAARATEPSA